MKKTLSVLILLLVLVTLGLFVSCNGNAIETVFDTSYKIQPDGSWKMGSQVYAPSTKPYILVLPKTLNVEKDVQLADLQAGLKTLDEIRSSDTAVEIGNATVQLKRDDFGNEYYDYINKGDESKAQNISMRTKDDYSETILLNAPYDEFSHYGSLNVATVGKVAQESYYEYGRVKKVVLSIGHLVAKIQSEIDLVYVDPNCDPEKVSVDIETTQVAGIVAPEEVLSKINKPTTVNSIKTGEKSFLASNGLFYDNFADIPSDVERVILLKDIDDLTFDKSVTFDLSGNTVSGTITIPSGKTVTLTCSDGKGKVEVEPEVEGTLIVEGGNYKDAPLEYVDFSKFSVDDFNDYYNVHIRPSVDLKDLEDRALLLPGGEYESVFAEVVYQKIKDHGNITSLVFRNRQKVPSNLPETDIVSTSISDKPAWLSFDNDANPTVLYVNTNGAEFIANPDCSKLFCKEYNHKNIALGNITTLDFGDGIFNTSQVTDMSFMFMGLEKLTSLDVSSFNTSNVTNMRSIFSGCSSLTTIDLSNFDTRKVNTMTSMFSSCYKMKSLDLSPLDTSHVEYMYFMFNCFARDVEEDVTLDLSTFDTSKVTDMSYMFQDAEISTLILGDKFVSTSVENMTQMFSSTGANRNNVKIDFGALTVPDTLGSNEKRAMFDDTALNSTSFKVKGDDSFYPELQAMVSYKWIKASQTPDADGFYLLTKQSK